MSGGLTWPGWVDYFINEEISGSTPAAKLNKVFSVSELRQFLYEQGHPSWAQASMFLQQHKYAQRWGTTEYMLRCKGKGPGSVWVVSNHETAQQSMEDKIDTLSREHINDILCRGKRLAEGNKAGGGAFDGDVNTLADVKREAEIIIGSWNFMRSTIYKLPAFDATKSWNNKYATV